MKPRQPRGRAQAGCVYLIGAGPGDPELMTLKGRRALESAHSVLYDEGIDDAVLAWAPTACERIYVGKRAGAHALPQAEIMRLMVHRALRGWRVARLKGGDPFVFGRGGEEAAALSAAGVRWEVIPGVSAANAAPALAGIPLTERGVAAEVLLRSGHAAAPAGGRTEVVFMGLARLPAIVAEMLRRGDSPATPIAVISRASQPGQRTVTGTLATVVARVAAARLESPALIVAGRVVRRRARLRATPEPTTPELPPALIVLAHGSPVVRWHASVERLVRELAVANRFVRAAYLEPARPRLREAMAAAAAAGQKRVVVAPYFLADGLHVTRDLPRLVAAERRRHPALKIAVAASLDGHPALRTALLARAAAAFSVSG